MVTMDIGALSAAIIGAVGGAAAAGFGGVVRAHTTERTAARLVFAELAQSSAAVAYFRSYGSWPAMGVTRTAWDRYSETLARARRPEMFERAQRGYAALDAIAYIAQDQALAPDDAQRLVDENVAWLVDALHTVGERAQSAAEALEEPVRRLSVSVGHGDQRSALVAAAPPSLLSQLLDMQIAVGHVPGSALEPPPTSSARMAPMALTVRGRTFDFQGADLRIYDAGGSPEMFDLPLVRTNQGPPSNDPTVEEVYEGLAATWAFYREVLGRNSIDDAGGAVKAIVHYDKEYNNTFWNHGRLVVGDGDGITFSRFSRFPEVLANQLSRVMTEQAGLLYKGQSGALTESICDVLGMLVKQWLAEESVRESDWLMAAGLFVTAPPGAALRSIKAPGSAYDIDGLGNDPQPSHMKDYVETQTDNQGVHINCGIPNRAFYLAAEAVGGNAWEVTGMIWYHTLVSGVLSAASTFSSFAGATLAVARRDYGEDSGVVAAIGEGWRSVGVRPRISKRASALLVPLP